MASLSWVGMVFCASVGEVGVTDRVGEDRGEEEAVAAIQSFASRASRRRAKPVFSVEGEGKSAQGDYELIRVFAFIFLPYEGDTDGDGCFDVASKNPEGSTELKYLNMAISHTIFSYFFQRREGVSEEAKIKTYLQTHFSLHSLSPHRSIPTPHIPALDPPRLRPTPPSAG